MSAKRESLRAVAEERGHLRALLGEALVDLRSLVVEAEDGTLGPVDLARWVADIDSLQSRAAVLLPEWKAKPCLAEMAP